MPEVISVSSRFSGTSFIRIERFEGISERIPPHVTPPQKRSSARAITQAPHNPWFQVLTYAWEFHAHTSVIELLPSKSQDMCFQ